MKELLFIVCTHGNESAPLEVLKSIIKKYGEENFYKNYDYIIANPKALEMNVRFTETDLNRIYPGNPESALYEERRATEILSYAKQFRYVIDLHTTTADSGIFTLVTKNTASNNELASKLFPKRVVIWESTSGRKTGPITSFLDYACEIECSINYPGHLEDLEESIKRAIDITDKKTEKKEWYRVIGSIPKDKESMHYGLKDFHLIEYHEKSLYPLLTGQYPDKACYIMEKIDEPLQTNTNQQS